MTLPTTGRASSLLIVIGVLGLLVGMSPVAASQPTLQLEPAAGEPKDWITISGSGYPDSTHGVVSFGSVDVAKVRANRSGDVAGKFRVPADAPAGEHTVAVTVGPARATAAFTVPGGPPPPSEPEEPTEIEPDAEPEPEAEPAPANEILFGVSTQNGWHRFSQLDDFEQKAGKSVGLFMYFQGWAQDADFNPGWLDPVIERGAVPVVTWEPWDYRSGVNQSEYRLSTIINGSHDAYIRRWAADAAQWGHPLMLRFAHEMNGSWYPWSEQTNRNRPGEYRAAWQHVHRLFQEAGATNVSFVWAPNVDYQGATPLGDLYPGHDVVDWVGLDGYNGGTALDWGGWLSFEQIFAASLDQLAGLAPGKPVVIAETASAEQGGDKAAWIHGFFDSVEARPDIRAFIWFNHDKETDWRIESSESARAAFAQRVADDRYR